MDWFLLQTGVAIVFRDLDSAELDSFFLPRSVTNKRPHNDVTDVPAYLMVRPGAYRALITKSKNASRCDKDLAVQPCAERICFDI